MSHTQTTPARSLTANGAVTVALPNSHSDGHVTIYASGDFGGGALAVSISPDGTAWFPVPGAVIDAAQYLPLTGILCRNIRFDLTGATDPAVNVVVLF